MELFSLFFGKRKDAAFGRFVFDDGKAFGILMRVIKKADVISQIFFKDFLHFSCKGTRISYRRPFLNTRRKSDRISAAFHQFICSKDCFLTGTTSAVAETNQFDFFIDPFENALVFFDHSKIGRARTLVFRLHTSYDTKFHFQSLTLRVVLLCQFPAQ